MAEFLWTFAVQEVLKMAITLVAEQIRLARGLNEVLEELQKELLTANGHLNAISRTKNSHDSLVTGWVNDLELIVHEARDMLDLFVYEDLQRKVESEKMRKVPSLSPSFKSSCVFRPERTKEIKKIIGKFSQHYNKLPHFAVNDKTTEIESEFIQIRETVSQPENFVVGRDTDLESIVDQVINKSKNQLNSILPIVGMGGSGKTTLAKLVFNDERIKKHFDQTIWVCVSEPFDVKNILGEILQTLGVSSSSPSKDSMETLTKKLKKTMTGDQKYFLVLDDVWNGSRRLWDKLNECLLGITETSGNSILVTTRNPEVAKMMEQTLPAHELSKLSDDQCWSLFMASANANEVPMTFNLKVVRKELDKKMGGLPLVAKALGGAVQFSGDYDKWVTTLQSVVRTPLEEENFVAYTLKLSMDRLPNSSIKQCFVLCAKFPKDFEFNKEHLIQMWMAQGFIQPDEGSNEPMEEIGVRYFNILVSRYLFQDVVKNVRGSIAKCKMHDLMHDIACSVANNDETTFLLHHSRNSLNTKSWSKLRVLIIDLKYIYEFPFSLSKLKHLRYFDISKSSIKKLPKSIGLLYNLQTLKLRWLPKDHSGNLSNLASLRHLEFLSHDQHMPPYLRHLTQLQTLSGFVVGRKKGCKITELGTLRNLKGSLKLDFLERVGSKEEAKSAKLVEKEALQEIYLTWNSDWERKVNNDNDLEVLEGLEPHKNLQGLGISWFQGKCFPDQIFVENLVRISLKDCRRCEELPMLGQLTNLEILDISRLPGVTSIGNEFYGSESNQGTIFPKLKEFHLEEMSHLVQWEEVTVASNVKTFPRLEELNLTFCDRLVKIPDVFGHCDENGEKHLEVVRIRKCYQLNGLPNGLRSFHSIETFKCPAGFVVEECYKFLHATRQGDI